MARQSGACQGVAGRQCRRLSQQTRGGRCVCRGGGGLDQEVDAAFVRETGRAHEPFRSFRLAGRDQGAAKRGRRLHVVGESGGCFAQLANRLAGLAGEGVQTAERRLGAWQLFGRQRQGQRAS